MDSIYAELKKANAEYYRAWTSRELLEKTLETDFNRIRKQEHLREQIEMYHQGYELNEDGTYIREPEPTSERNAELDYLARLEERQRRAEMEYLLKLEQQEKQEQARRRSYDYSR